MFAKGVARPLLPDAEGTARLRAVRPSLPGAGVGLLAGEPGAQGSLGGT